MKKVFFMKSRTAMRLLAIATIISTWLPSSAAWGVVVITPPDIVPLNQVPVPTPTNLIQFVKDNGAAARLGKALFWDMQVGSDGLTACGSCHFSAGVDKRVKNTVHPGPGNVWETVIGPNQTLPMDTTVFPFHQKITPDIQSSGVARDFRDIVGSQGVRKANFLSITPGSAVDNVTPVTDALFNITGTAAGNVRQVTGRNTPSMINAIFNFNNFWDGRAHFVFNGENPFGPADPNAGVYFNNPAGATLAKQKIAMEFAAMASQAVGPVLNDVEMSAIGRTFPEVGRKLLSLTPLGKQLVHPGDSTHGFISRAVKQPDGSIIGANGLSVTYSQMIQAAFQNNLWSSPQTVTLNTVGGPQAFSQMEANFSLFWGLAVQAYVATLVSDQTPFDRYLGGDNLALTDQQKLGFAIFQGVGNCTVCHGTSELTNISQTSIAFLTNEVNALVDLMFVAEGTQVIYDNGFFNTAVTPIADDIGRGGNTPFFNPLTTPPNQPIPLSLMRLAELQALGQLPFLTPILEVFIPPDFPVNANGAFKAPGLRNVELTAPYFHNGGARTLEEVVEFYTRGGNFPIDNIAELDPLIHVGVPLLQNNPVMRAALVAFLKSLTDPRVAAASGPFDHPEIFVPAGDPEVLTRVAATDANGVAAPQLNLTLGVTTPTNVATQTITGTVQAGMTTPQVTVNGGLPISATVTGTSWNAAINLGAGANTIAVSSQDSVTLVQTALTATITLDIVAPAVTINPVTSPTSFTTQAISGSVEAGASVAVRVNGGAPALAAVTGATWSFTATLPNTGATPNTIDVSATDAAGNTTVLPSVTISVSANVPPIAVNDAAATTAGVARTINVILNDTGVSSAIAPTTIIVTSPINGGASVANPDGTVTYTPAANFTGTDFFAYTVKDLLGAVSNPAAVTISVTPGATTPPAPTAETVNVLRAQYRATNLTSGEWVVEGTTNNTAATLITISVGNSTTGQIVGTAVPAAGTWRFRSPITNTVRPDATNTISVLSSPSGASRLAFPVSVR